MREIFVLNHVASSATNPRKVAQALADYEQSPSLTHFCVLLFIDPRDLPAKFFQDAPGKYSELTQLLTNRSKASKFLETRLKNGFPFNLTAMQLLYWVGVIRVTHAMYRSDIPGVLLGYQHQVMGLAGCGELAHARQLFHHLVAVQDAYGIEVAKVVRRVRQSRPTPGRRTSRRNAPADTLRGGPGGVFSVQWQAGAPIARVG